MSNLIVDVLDKAPKVSDNDEELGLDAGFDRMANWSDARRSDSAKRLAILCQSLYYGCEHYGISVLDFERVLIAIDAWLSKQTAGQLNRAITNLDKNH